MVILTKTLTALCKGSNIQIIVWIPSVYFDSSYGLNNIFFLTRKNCTKIAVLNTEKLSEKFRRYSLAPIVYFFQGANCFCLLAMSKCLQQVFWKKRRNLIHETWHFSTPETTMYAIVCKNWNVNTKQLLFLQITAGKFLCSDTYIRIKFMHTHIYKYI